MLKRQIPLLIVIGVGLLTLSSHFINHQGIKDFADNDATQWFDIIASFAIFLGALNMLKMQMQKIIRKHKNWPYSLLAIIGFAFAIFAGFFYRGSNYIVISNLNESDIVPISELLVSELDLENPIMLQDKIRAASEGYEIPKIFKTLSGAQSMIKKLEEYDMKVELKSKRWGTHLQTKGSLFSWLYFKIFYPLSASMFALLAFFVASASYRAFRIRNFEATLLLVSGIILMLGRVPIGELIPWWVVAILIVFGLGAISAPWIKDRKTLFGFIVSGIVLFLIAGTSLGWNNAPPKFLLIPVIQDWIFDYPTIAGARALIIGIALGIVATSFRIMIGRERSFLGD